MASLAAGRGLRAVTELLWVRLPLRRPLRSAHGTESVRQVILVKVIDEEGVVGWGECSALEEPTYTSEYTAGAWSVLRYHLGSGRDAAGHPMAAAALLGAEQDLALRRQGTSLVDRVGSRMGRPTLALPTTAVVGRHDAVDDVLAVVAAHVADGVAMVKLKVTPRPADLAAVRAVRAAWPDLPLAVDGNGTLDARSVTQLDGLELAYVEQPAPADDLLESARLARQTSVPVALDESITSPAVLATAAAVGAGSVVNVKPARLGGVPAALDTMAAAVDAGWGIFVGGMLETGVGRATALAVAAAPACTFPTDLGPSDRYFAHDVVEPIGVDRSGRVVVPTGAGIGVSPIEGRLEELTVDHLVLR